MRRSYVGMAAAAATAALTLAACGGGAQPEGEGEGGGAATGGVGVILPDTVSSVRWEQFDRPYLEDAFEAAGIEYDIQNAEGDAQRMQTIADQMITSGISVLALVNLDSDSAATIQQSAEQAGVQTIDYDRLTLGGSAEYYVSFDNVVVGEEQGRGLQQCLGEGDANIVYLNGAPTDNNATLFSQGAHSVLDAVENYEVVAEQAVPEWDNQQAATIFDQMWTEEGGEIDGVVAANDGLANAVISVLERNGAAGDVPVTGQDATVEGLQHILAGDQCMTVYKPAHLEAQALADLVIALLNGEEAETTTTVRDETGGRDVPAVLLDPIAIFQDNVSQVVDDGVVSAEELCEGEFAEPCADAGIE
ncbi:sugar ABC transporter substrate-binding protein [Allonocardiopsis opalescens]|uniref:Monosaccharide ABC transporter substrate-binding protein (CUT2 family) n=1 Tax=Allonocardiopsis opalescens TaxID=1144618 RepID=A0A2T0QAQ6_9ACTN|nr:substrate-binding domain-containing protein [Allonocardiopsis opalescens]PRY00905.1 monosaccharide ABC transporter substrate-binding protein (CUT2 family) [Allonocardiopsis opalescens]